MAKCLQLSTGPDQSVGNEFGTYGMAWMVHERGRSAKQEFAATLSDLRVIVSTNSSLSTDTASIRINNVRSSLEVSIPTLTTGKFDDSDTASVSAGDDLDINSDQNGGGTLIISLYSVACDADTNTRTLLTCRDSGPNTIEGVRINAFVGDGLIGGGEPNTSVRCRITATLRNFYHDIRTNSKDATTTCITRIDSVDGNQSLSISASATGHFTDTTNTDSVSDGSDFNSETDTSASTTGTFETNSCGVEVESTASQSMVVNGDRLTEVQAFNLTKYMSMGGWLQARATESDYESDCKFDFTGKLFWIRISANTIATSATTARTRKNAANGGQSVSIGAGATGEFEDNSGTDTLVAADEYNYQVVTPDTSGNLSMKMMGSVAEVVGAVAIQPKTILMREQTV